MTTTVRITAHCSADKEVLIEIREGQSAVTRNVLQDGQSADVYACGDRVVSVREVLKK